MSKNALLSAQGSFLVGVDVDKANEFDVVDLIRAKKMSLGLLDSAPRFDFDNDGDVDDADVKKLKNIMLGVEELETTEGV